MRRYAIASVRMALVTLVILGLAYPLLVTGAAQVLFPWQANGSLVERDGKVVGSALIGQAFDDPGYFHGRPSAGRYDPAASGASNLGPTSPDLLSRVAAAVAEAEAEDGVPAGRVPVDMVTASGSGLDPDISVANALAQVPRVAAARGMTEQAVRRIVERNVTRRQLGFLGEERVNVLVLDLALDEAAGRLK